MNLKINYNKILFFLFVITPLVDSINGILLRLDLPIIISFGQIYRMFLLVVLLSIIILNKKNFKVDLFTLSMIMYLIVITAYYFFYHKSLMLLINDYIILSKFILIVLIVESFKLLSFANKIDKNIINRILYYLGIITPLTIILPFILGVGYSTYKSGGGYKAFYSANNDLSIVIMVLFIFFLHRVFFKNGRNKKYIDFLILILIAISNFLIGSKTNLILPFILVAIFIFKLFCDKKISKRAKRYIILISISSLIMVTIFILNIDIIQQSIDRFQYFLNDSDFLSFIFSARNRMLSQAIDNLKNERNFILKLFFGIGFSYRSAFWNTGKIIEMDIFDIFICYGFFGFVFIYSYILKIFIKFKNKYYLKNFGYITSFIVTMFFSTFAGHVMFSALSGTIFALIMSQLIIEDLANSNDNS